MKINRPSRRAKGVALYEVLVSVVLFSIGVLGLLVIHAHAAQITVDADDRARAAMLASRMAGILWAQKSTTTIDATAYATWQAQVADPTNDGLPNGVGTLTTGTPATITIAWRAPWRKSSEQNKYVTEVTIP